MKNIPNKNILIKGALCGFLGTIPMTLWMKGFQKSSEKEKRNPLPPKKITDNALDKAELKEELSEESRLGLTLVGHFAYGSLMGALFAFKKKDRLPHPLTEGVNFGLKVWGYSYLGWLPFVGLHKSAVHEPPVRNSLMASAHVVWGAATGYLYSRI
jgi:hypothetical protein